MDSRYAQKIINVAKGETVPPPYGKVNDFQRVSEGGKLTELRYGWERLKEYFEQAGGFTEANWKFKGQFNNEELSALDGVRLRNKRVPQRNQGKDGSVSWSGTQWCGIFASWCWKAAGVPGAKWAFPGVKALNVKMGQGVRRYKPDDLILSDMGLGDIAVLKDDNPQNRLVHHCIVTRFLGGNEIETVNGNSDYQGITVKNIKLQKVEYFYTVKSPIDEILRDLYGEKPGASSPAPGQI